MDALDRRRLLKAGLGATMLGGFAGKADAAEFAFKLGADWPSDHPSSVSARKACDLIRQRSNGRLDIQYFANNILGGDTDMLSQVRSGAIELVAMPTSVSSTLVAVSAINNTGFAFDGYDQVWPAMDGKLGAYVRDKFEKINLAVMDKIWDNGFRQMTTGSVPIASLAAIKGLKMRVPVSPIYVSLMRGLGCSPVSANINELYSALQTKVFDGEENTWANLQFFKLFEVQKFVGLTDHMWEGYWILGNKRALARLPKDLLAILNDTMNEVAVSQRADIARFSAQMQKQLEGEGMQFERPDREQFRQALTKSGFYAEWRKQFGEEAWSLLEASTRKLT